MRQNISRVGYIVKELKKSIETTLGFAKTKNAYIIGAGNLGMALAKYDNFTSYGLNILDVNKDTFKRYPEKDGLINNTI